MVLSNKKIICEINMLNYLFHLMFANRRELIWQITDKLLIW